MNETYSDIEQVLDIRYNDSNSKVFGIPERNYESVDFDNILPYCRTNTIDDVTSRTFLTYEPIQHYYGLVRNLPFMFLLGLQNWNIIQERLI